jgi:hypothetical protein
MTGTLLIGISRLSKLPAVTTDLGTKLGTRLSNGVAIHHCRDGLLPLLAAIPSSPTPTIGSLLSWPAPQAKAFEACSSFTRVTACRVAHPPYVGFITRLHPCRFPGSGARKLPSSTNNLLGWVLPPLVICAVEARPLIPLTDRNRLTQSRKTLQIKRLGLDLDSRRRS